MNSRARWGVLALAVAAVCGAVIHSRMASAQTGAPIVSRAQVVSVRVDASGRGIVQMDTPTSNKPTATTSTWAYHWAFDVSDPGGEGILSTVTAASLADKPVTIVGYSQTSAELCDIYAGHCIPTIQFAVIY